MRYLYPFGNENAFAVTEFFGDDAVATNAGYVAVSDEQFQALERHLLRWENGTLAPNFDQTRDDGTETGLVYGSFDDAYVKRLVAEFAEKGAKLFPVENVEKRDLSKIKFALMPNERMQKQLQKAVGDVLFVNTSDAASIANDKWLTYCLLKNAGVPQPRTQKTIDGMTYPVVVKGRHGSLGKKVFLANDFFEALALSNKLGEGDVIYQQFIEESAGTDVRVICIGGKAKFWYRRRNDDDFRANMAQGAVGEVFDLPDDFKAVAEAAAQTLRLDFCGVDVLFGANGPLVCEVNSRPQVAGAESTLEVNVMAELAQYVMDKTQN